MKATLFRIFYINMYCGHLWHDVKKSALKQLIVGYNHSFIFLMKYHRNCIVSCMFVFNGLPSFMEMWHQYFCDNCCTVYMGFFIWAYSLAAWPEINVLLTYKCV